ncbi:unnamed protein product [Protopolystoma xenopodis]|uniref:Uncharacterized protein n=1 Tax=Protopolystoma xenopodis TaxID=117903 RepID=A0A448WYR7_9PLAT|nr:unnamed protein product [Protopolystoma xenopodis]
MPDFLLITGLTNLNISLSATELLCCHSTDDQTISSDCDIEHCCPNNIFGSCLHTIISPCITQLPARGLYLLWVNILAPWIFDPNQEPEINEKKQRKLERRQKRMANAGR